MDEEERVTDEALQLTITKAQHVTTPCSGSEVFTSTQYYLRRVVKLKLTLVYCTVTYVANN